MNDEYSDEDLEEMPLDGSKWLDIPGPFHPIGLGYDRSESDIQNHLNALDDRAKFLAALKGYETSSESKLREKRRRASFISSNSD